MSLYDEQIRQRYKNDEDMLLDAYEAAANAVTGKSFSLGGNYPENAMGEVLKYFHAPLKQNTDAVTDADQSMELALRSAGIMKRNVFLYDDWYKDTWGVYLARLKESGEVVAIIPKGLKNIAYFDTISGKYIKITKHNADLFEKAAVCLYRPLPMKSLTVSDMFKFCFSTWSAGDVAYTLILMLIATLLGLLTPKISYFMFSKVATEQSISLLLSTLVFGVFTGIASVIITTMYRCMAGAIGIKMRTVVEGATMMRVLTLPLEFFSKYSAGDISKRVTYMQDFCLRVEDEVIVTGLTAIFSLAYFSQILLYTPSLALPVAVIIIVSLLFCWISALYQYKVSKVELELSARNQGVAYDTLSGIEKIKLAGAEKRMFARYAKDFADVARVAYNPPLLVKLSVPISLMITLAGQFIIYYIALETKVGYAEYYAFQTAYASICGGLTILSTVALTSTKLFGSLAMIRPIIETAPEVCENLVQVTDLRGSVELNNVYFKYDDGVDDVIKGMTLKIKPGEYVAIVGKSGCGKSTLVRLLLGFVRPRTGAVYYDNKDLTQLDKSSLRRRIGVVLQNDALFNGSIYENITVSVPGAPMEVAWKAAEAAGVAETIQKLPMGMHTMIGEDNGGFSGGEKQRLIIARAVASNPRILIFDEATSALDNKTQKRVSESLDALKCTRIVIAHRLSTIKNCNRILFMEKGMIVEEGTYDELIAKGGKFADLVERQRLDKINLLK